MRENEEKIRTRITPNTDTYFIRSDIVKDLLIIATEDIHKKTLDCEKVLTLNKPVQILKKNISEY